LAGRLDHEATSLRIGQDAAVRKVGWHMNRDDFPAPKDGFVLTHFLVVADQDRSRDFYQRLFDAQVVVARDPVIIKVANSWLILNQGGGPTDDTPTVTLTTAPDPNRTSAFLNVHVADIDRVYKEWSARGAEFLTAPRTTDARSAPTSAIPTAI
jgi:lactoylglutathione lyase